MDLNAVAGFLDDLAARCGDRLFAALELAARQHPGVILRALDHGDELAGVLAQDNAACRLYGLPRHVFAPAGRAFIGAPEADSV